MLFFTACSFSSALVLLKPALVCIASLLFLGFVCYFVFSPSSSRIDWIGWSRDFLLSCLRCIFSLDLVHLFLSFPPLLYLAFSCIRLLLSWRSNCSSIINCHHLILYLSVLCWCPVFGSCCDSKGIRRCSCSSQSVFCWGKINLRWH